MKKAILISLVIIGQACIARDGMWLLPLLQKQNESEMQSMGMKISANDIYSIDNTSLKDAVVHFGGGCTGEVISNQGLILTNHHCGFNYIQALSTVQKNYLQDGYWSSSYAEELPCTGLTITFVKEIRNVSREINAALNESMTEQDRDKKIKELSDSLEKKAVEGTEYKAAVRSFYNGNEFYLFVNEVFRDIRFVGAPPLSIGRFGGETDNWVWPRHTCDFSLFRVYANKENKPADYSKDNVPYKPKNFFTISIGGVKEGDFAMVMGFPGRTNEYLSSYGMEQIYSQTNPDRIKIRDLKLNIINRSMQKNDTIRLQYAPKYKTIANAYKKWKGEEFGLLRDSVIQKKQNEETEFTEWVEADPARKNKYGKLLNDLQKNYAESKPLNFVNDYLAEALNGIEIVTYSQKFSTLISLSQKDPVDTAAVNAELRKLMKGVDDFYKNYNAALDRELCGALLKLFDDDVPKNLRPGIYEVISSKFKNDFEKYVEAVYSRSMFASKEKLVSFLKNYRPKDARKLQDDEAYKLSMSIKDFNDNQISASLSKLSREQGALQRTYVKALREMKPQKIFYPDANSTLRVAYGKVSGYKARDGVYCSFLSTLDGIIEKWAMKNPDYPPNEKLASLYSKKDYGRYSQNGTVPVDFLSSSHTTGGNSGSPVINANGQLIGANFDRAWEGTACDYYYEEKIGRNISVDIRYILFIIEKYGEANRLIEEMKIVGK